LNNKTYKTFEIRARLYGNTLVLKHEENAFARDRGKASKLFEEFLTDPWNFEACHLVIHAKIKKGKSSCKMLLRCEVDCCLPKTPMLKSVDQYATKDISSTKLVIHWRAEPAPKLELQHLAEIQMNSLIDADRHIFPSTLAGIPTIVHGVSARHRCAHQVGGVSHQGCGAALNI
jgi:hypothetical protein